MAFGIAYFLIEDLALINMGLSDKAAALTLTDRATAVIPVEKDALSGPRPIEIVTLVASRVGEPDRAIAMSDARKKGRLSHFRPEHLKGRLAGNPATG